MDDIHKYDSIINLPHRQSDTRRHMSMAERAAQFAPFAALTGYDGIINETRRLTEDWTAPDGEKLLELNLKASLLMEMLEEKKENPQVSVTYFEPDRLKSGGKYITYNGRVRLIDTALRFFIMADGTKICMDLITAIEIVP